MKVAVGILINNSKINYCRLRNSIIVIKRITLTKAAEQWQMSIIQISLKSTIEQIEPNGESAHCWQSADDQHEGCRAELLDKGIGDGWPVPSMTGGDGQRASQRSMRAQSSRSAFSATSTHCVCDSAASSLTLTPATASNGDTSDASGPGT